MTNPELSSVEPDREPVVDDLCDVRAYIGEAVVYDTVEPFCPMVGSVVKEFTDDVGRVTEHRTSPNGTSLSWHNKDGSISKVAIDPRNNTLSTTVTASDVKGRKEQVTTTGDYRGPNGWVGTPLRVEPVKTDGFLNVHITPATEPDIAQAA